MESLVLRFMLKKGNERMTIELTERQREIIKYSLLKFSATYEDKSELAYKTNDSKRGKAFMDYAGEIFETYQIVKQQ